MVLDSNLSNSRRETKIEAVDPLAIVIIDPDEVPSASSIEDSRGKVLVPLVFRRSEMCPPPVPSRAFLAHYNRLYPLPHCGLPVTNLWWPLTKERAFIVSRITKSRSNQFKARYPGWDNNLVTGCDLKRDPCLVLPVKQEEMRLIPIE
jgi:hypothetical protein